MPKHRVDAAIRRRIASHVRGYMAERRIQTNLELADRVKVNPSVISRVLSGKGALGLDVFVAIHRELRISADLMLDEDYRPPKTFVGG